MRRFNLTQQTRFWLSIPQFGMSRQISMDWNVDASGVAEAHTLAKESSHADCAEAVFLLAKGIENTYTVAPSGEPMKTYDLILNPPNAHWQQCRARLHGILFKEGDSTADEVPPSVISFATAMEKMPQWSSGYVFHRSKGIVVVQRWQRSGLCYIHAAVVVHYYLAALHANKRRAGMIDMTKWIRQSFHHKELDSHIFRDQGGSSINVLERILLPGSMVSGGEIASAGSRLREFGPLLISTFAVHEDFYDTDVLSFDGKPAGKLIGHHVMVLIGHRVDSEGKEWFLVQNWWPQMQFVEMSAEYLKRCGARLSYVETPQTEVREELPIQQQLFAENENIDKPEDKNFTEPECPPPPM